MIAIIAKRLVKYSRLGTRSWMWKPWEVQGVEALKPIGQIRRLEPRQAWEWHATGDDPQFLLGSRLPLPGWQMLEVAMQHDQPSVVVKLYLDFGQGFSETGSIPWRLRVTR